MPSLPSSEKSTIDLIEFINVSGCTVKPFLVAPTTPNLPMFLVFHHKSTFLSASIQVKEMEEGELIVKVPSPLSGPKGMEGATAVCCQSGFSKKQRNHIRHFALTLGRANPYASVDFSIVDSRRRQAAIEERHKYFEISACEIASSH